MRVVVLGAGYAGLTVARRLERQLPNDVELLVVDESDVHLVQHELHRVIRRPGIADTITVPLEDVLGRATVRRARVTDVDTERGEVTLDAEEAGGTETVEYDFAAVCLGAETEFYGLPGVEEHALPLKRLHHATAIRDAVTAAAGGEVVVGGAGLSGVQVAAEINALSTERELDLDVTLLEMSDRITPGFHATFGAAVRRELEAQGVTVRTGATVAEADDSSVHLGEGDAVPYDVFVWTGGLRGPSALGGERPAVDADLEVAEGTFVVGDAATVTDNEGRTVPASAQTAVREAKVAATNIAAGVRASRPVDRPGDVEVDDLGDRESSAGHPDTYHFDVPGWIVSVADTAVAQLGPVVLTGEPAKVAKAAVGAGHLGSVGEVERASQLVHDELGWPAGRAVDLPGSVLRRYSITSSTDPGTPSDFEYPVALLDDVVNGALSSDDPLDITALTRVVDRDSPGSAADLAGRTVVDGVNTVLSLALGSGTGPDSSSGEGRDVASGASGSDRVDGDTDASDDDADTADGGTDASDDDADTADGGTDASDEDAGTAHGGTDATDATDGDGDGRTDGDLSDTGRTDVEHDD